MGAYVILTNAHGEVTTVFEGSKEQCEKEIANIQLDWVAHMWESISYWIEKKK